jgi:hypothetical protein
LCSKSLLDSPELLFVCSVVVRTLVRSGIVLILVIVVRPAGRAFAGGLGSRFDAGDFSRLAILKTLDDAVKGVQDFVIRGAHGLAVDDFGLVVFLNRVSGLNVVAMLESEQDALGVRLDAPGKEVETG